MRSKINLRHRPILVRAVATLLAVLVVSVIAWAARQTAFTLALAAGGAALAGLLSAWAGRSVTRRLGHAREISRAWLHGNLSLRIADPLHDDVGLLAAQLDLLAEHLEQDERDLAALRERNARLTDQVRALTVVEERNRLARELHDSVKQSLFSLTMTASGIRARLDTLPDAPADLAEMVREVEASAQSAQREMTRLIEDLRSKTLQEQGLAATLNDYTLLCGAREHLLIYLDVQGNDALLPPSVAEALYRVAQEALHNVARHARATRADVNLRCLPEQVMLTVRDNGVGFDTGQAQRGLGLANMQERVMSVGGRLAVESQPGAGTTVLVQVGLTPRGVLRTEIAAQGELRPNPSIENWAWLGQRLVIPVGQTWPWLPADQMHLRRPLVEAGEKPLLVKKHAGTLGLGRGYVLQPTQCRTPLVRVRYGRSGYEWKIEDAAWTLRHVRGLNGRMVLQRKGQPLAAMQYQGRQLSVWSEIVYDGRGYRLSYVQDMPCHCILADETGAELLLAQGDSLPQITLRRALPLPLLVMVALRIVDEISVKIGGKT